MRKITGFLASLRGNLAGTGALELGLALPVLILLLVGMIDVSRLVASRIDVEQAAQRTTDFALAKRPTSANGKYIKDEAAKIDNVSANDVTVDIFLECDGVRQSDFRNICPSTEDSARFVSVEIDRNVSFLFNWSSFANLFFGKQVLGQGIRVQGDSIVRFQ